MPARTNSQRNNSQEVTTHEVITLYESREQFYCGVRVVVMSCPLISPPLLHDP